MSQYILCERSGIHIIDLEQTQSLLDAACEFMRHASSQRKNIILIGSKKQASEIIEEEARRCGAFFVNRRWLGGTITNFEIIRTRIARLNELDQSRDSGDLFRRPKKEQAILNREIFRLAKYLGGIKTMRGLPDVIFTIDQNREHIAVSEAMKLGITIVGVVDTNCSPEGIDFVIPGNDDSFKSIKLITSKIADAIIEGNESADRARKRYPRDDGPDLSPSRVPKSPLPLNHGAAVALPIPSVETRYD